MAIWVHTDQHIVSITVRDTEAFSDLGKALKRMEGQNEEDDAENEDRAEHDAFNQKIRLFHVTHALSG